MRKLLDFFLKILKSWVIFLGKHNLNIHNLEKDIQNEKKILLYDSETPTLYYYFSGHVRRANISKENHFSLKRQIKEHSGNIILIRGVSCKNFCKLLVLIMYVKHITIFVDDAMDLFSEEKEEYFKNTAFKFYLAVILGYLKNISISVSTVKLANKFNVNASNIISPSDFVTIKRKSFSYFYYGTSVHAEEIDFLVLIVKQVQSLISNIRFEIICSKQDQKKFKFIPRVNILYPMNWNNFYYYTSNISHNVGLAPLLGSEINKYRAHTKFFDIRRCGAVGIYSDIGVYDLIKDNNAGIVIDNFLESWVVSIETLYRNENLRVMLYNNSINFKGIK